MQHVNFAELNTLVGLAPMSTQLAGARSAALPLVDGGEKLSVTMRLARDWLEAHGPGILAAFGLLIIGWLLAAWARRLVFRAFERAHIDMTLGKFFANLSRWAILAFVVVTCMGTLGISTTGFATIIGAAGLAIGLALQGNLSNLASGVLILIFRPFKLGDSVIVAGQTGIVDGIDLFTTNLDTPDNRRVIVPNSSIFGGVIENQTRHPTRRVDLNVPVAPSAEYDRVRAALMAAIERALAQTPGSLPDPAPTAAMNEIAPVTWQVTAWAKTGSHGALRQALLREIKLALEKEKLGPPGPSMDIRVLSMPKE